MNWTKRFCVKPGERPSLDDSRAGRTDGIARETAEAETAKDIAALPGLQFRLYAEGRRALLVVLQAMDGGGKDGTIRRVMSVLNPQGCRVTSFKAPTPEERAHDFLWRIHKAVPAAGEIGTFNRSHYEDVLIVRVHELAPKTVWSRRYDQINRFEKHLAANGVRIVKFFLHIGADEQKERFEARMDDPARNWKVNPADFSERRHWSAYRAAYRDAIARCSTPWAPWFVIPSDRKWFRNMVVARILRETLEDMDPRFPPPPPGLKKFRVPPAG